MLRNEQEDDDPTEELVLRRTDSSARHFRSTTSTLMSLADICAAQQPLPTPAQPPKKQCTSLNSARMTLDEYTKAAELCGKKYERVYTIDGLLDCHEEIKKKEEEKAKQQPDSKTQHASTM